MPSPSTNTTSLSIEMHQQDAARKAAAFSLVAASFKNAAGSYDLRGEVGVLAELLRGFSPSLELSVQGLELKWEQAFVQSMSTRGVLFRSIKRGSAGAASPGTLTVRPGSAGLLLPYQPPTNGLLLPYNPAANGLLLPYKGPGNDVVSMFLLLPAVQVAQAERR